LTAIGGSAPDLNVAEEIQSNSFKIAGGKPNMKVSWQVTGIRQDTFAKANPVKIEEMKQESERGKTEITFDAPNEK
ncbi:MAG: hypothetical protein HYZ34_15315, partial [Ignavibacteriae bacterium]|nr:hypothetical protein [Ignavibacteriota bacterium]